MKKLVQQGADEARNESYEVGYGRPPAKSRFQPGQSGNPKGRPKGAKSIADTIADAFSERVQVVEGGKKRWFSKLELMLHNMLARAATKSGGMRDLQTLMKMLGYDEIPIEPWAREFAYPPVQFNVNFVESRFKDDPAAMRDQAISEKLQRRG